MESISSTVGNWKVVNEKLELEVFQRQVMVHCFLQLIHYNKESVMGWSEEEESLIHHIQNGWDSRTQQALPHPPQELRKGIPSVPGHWPKGWKWSYPQIRNRHEETGVPREGDWHGMDEVLLNIAHSFHNSRYFTVFGIISLKSCPS